MVPSPFPSFMKISSSGLLDHNYPHPPPPRHHMFITSISYTCRIMHIHTPTLPSLTHTLTHFQWEDCRIAHSHPSVNLRYHMHSFLSFIQHYVPLCESLTSIHSQSMDSYGRHNLRYHMHFSHSYSITYPCARV